jgi:hypothetical protein
LIAYLAAFALGALGGLHGSLWDFDGLSPALGRYLAARGLKRAGEVVLCVRPEDLAEVDASRDPFEDTWTFTYAVRRSGFEGARVTVRVDRRADYVFTENEAMRQAGRRQGFRQEPCGNL